jgi:uncharacterized membrane protein (Fun14 family)
MQLSSYAAKQLTMIVVLLLLAVSPLAGQQPGSEIRVYLMTLGPGDAVWERFGHNAIVVEDASIGQSIAYNWGMFDFEEPGYVARLMKGRMIYWMAGYPTDAFVNAYVQQNRTIWMDELNLTPQQRIAMRDFVAWNALETNKFYRYDYYRDNCSTRVRDAIDHVLGGPLRTAWTAIPTEATYRSHTQRLTFDDPVTYTGLELAMGHPIDVPLTAWEEGFIPMELRKWVLQARVRAANGREVPLVTRSTTVFEAQRAALPEQAPNLIVWYLLAGLLIAGLMFLLGRRPVTATRKPILIGVLGLWCLLVGFFGTLIVLLWAFTDHSVTYNNENILQANPFVLALGGFAVVALATGRAQKTAARLALLVGGLSVLGFVLQVFPGLDQVNGEMIALLMPVHVVIAYILSSPRNTVTA